MWTGIARFEYDRSRLRYVSNLTGPERALSVPFLPGPAVIDLPQVTELSNVMTAHFYITTMGCQLQRLPKDFPPSLTVQHYFYLLSSMRSISAPTSLSFCSIRS